MRKERIQSSAVRADTFVKVPGNPGLFRKGNRVYDTWTERGRSRRKAYRTLTAAKQGRAERIAHGGAAPSRERFDRYAERWLVKYQGRSSRPISERTRERYMTHMRYATDYFRGTPIGDLTPLDVRGFLEHLQKQKPRRGSKRGAKSLAPATIVSIMGALKAMLAEAYELGLTRTDVGRVRVIVRGAGGRRRRAPRTLTREQMNTLLAKLSPRDRVLFYFLARTGLRIGEALGLKWRDLERTPGGLVLVIDRQAQGGELEDEGKTENALRSVAILPSLARVLTRYRASAEYAGADDPIFASLTGTHQDSHNVRRRLRPAAKEAGVEWATPHVFRHTLATELRDGGVLTTPSSRGCSGTPTRTSPAGPTCTPRTRRASMSSMTASRLSSAGSATRPQRAMDRAMGRAMSARNRAESRGRGGGLKALQIG
jgi:integrase